MATEIVISRDRCKESEVRLRPEIEALVVAAWLSGLFGNSLTEVAARIIEMWCWDNQERLKRLTGK